MVSVVWRARNLGQHRRHLGVVEQRSFGFLHRIDQVKAAPAARFVAVPEAIPTRQPVRCDGGIENQLSDFWSRPMLSQFVVSFLNLNRFRLGVGGLQRQRHQCGENENTILHDESYVAVLERKARRGAEMLRSAPSQLEFRS